MSRCPNFRKCPYCKQSNAPSDISGGPVLVYVYISIRQSGSRVPIYHTHIPESLKINTMTSSPKRNSLKAVEQYNATCVELAFTHTML